MGEAARPADDWRQVGFGVYVHWPFCQAKCPYCDFNSHVAARIDQARWRAAYAAELSRAAVELPGRVVRTVFFGGGTPSLMEPETVAAVLEAVRAAWPVANDLEVTLEANPSSVEAGRFAAYRAAGVDRISIGVQALNDADLRRLGRLHDVAQARAAVALAQGLFDRVSLDLIYARQDQTLADWAAELREALAMGVDHLSLYQLTVEEGTPFAARARAGGLRGLPDEDLAAEMYALTQETCAAAGLPAYEVSNHARLGAESRHNLLYWRSGDWLGVGPGAHGRLTLEGRRWATEAVRAPGDWLTRVERDDGSATERVALSGRDAGEEALMMGLRLAEGVETGRIEQLGLALNPNDINALCGDGVLEVRSGRLRTTPGGRLVLNAVLRRLLAG